MIIKFCIKLGLYSILFGFIKTKNSTQISISIGFPLPFHCDMRLLSANSNAQFHLLSHNMRLKTYSYSTLALGLLPTLNLPTIFPTKRPSTWWLIIKCLRWITSRGNILIERFVYWGWCVYITADILQSKWEVHQEWATFGPFPWLGARTQSSLDEAECVVVETLGLSVKTRKNTWAKLIRCFVLQQVLRIHKHADARWMGYIYIYILSCYHSRWASQNQHEEEEEVVRPSWIMVAEVQMQRTRQKGMTIRICRAKTTVQPWFVLYIHHQSVRHRHKVREYFWITRVRSKHLCLCAGMFPTVFTRVFWFR